MPAFRIKAGKTYISAEEEKIMAEYFADGCTFKDLLRKLGENKKQYDTEKIERAYELADGFHKGQKRDSGEEYISHPIAVSCILAELGMDSDTICAGLLHDVVEDTSCSLEDLTKQFGEGVALLVDGVTKLRKIPLATKEEQTAENVRKILLAMSEDIRVMIIKLSDRLHNMRTLGYRSEEKRRSTALETMNIYAPIAHRLGISWIKEELEDLSFQYLDPYAYEEIERLMNLRRDDRIKFIEEIKSSISERLAGDFKTMPTIEGRVKSNYGIYKKVYRDGKEFDQIYDRYAVRIIVNTVNECYNVLGIIHDMFNPIPNRFKDYISTPKANMYQSLHTTVIGASGIPFEVQIRTYEMHQTAEFGIAAHWKYKEGITSKSTKDDNRLAWVRQILESQQNSDDAEEIVRTIKSDLSPEEIFVFTPKGDMITLPKGATVIDFAYAIHTQVGHRMCGAKVDKKMVSLDCKVKTGQIVEIITSSNATHGPNRSWLQICRTNEARSKIRSWFKKERREENIFEGRSELEREFRRNYIRIPENELEDFLSNDMRRHNCETLDDFFAAIGYGGIQVSKLIQHLKDAYNRRIQERHEPTEEQIMKQAKEGLKSKSGVIVDGIGDCEIKFAQCCNPLPGDAIVGFVTRGHGISVHKADCMNYLSQKDNELQKDRWLDVRWAEKDEKLGSSSYFKATLDIVANDRIGLLADISVALAEIRIPMHEATARELKNGNANVVVTISVAGREQLTSVMNRLSKIPSVLTVDECGK